MPVLRAIQGICRTHLAPWSGPLRQGGFIPDFGLEIVFLFLGQAPRLPRKAASLRLDKSQ